MDMQLTPRAAGPLTRRMCEPDRRVTVLAVGDVAVEASDRWRVESVTTMAEALARVASGVLPPACALVGAGTGSLAALAAAAPGLAIVAEVAAGDEARALEALREGAHETVANDADPWTIDHTVQRALVRAGRAAPSGTSPHAPDTNAMAAIVRCSTDAMVMVSTDLTVVTWNEAAAALYGVPAEVAIGRSALDFTPPVERPLVRRRFDRVIAGETVRYNAARTHPDGTVKHVHLAASPVVDERGRVTHVAIVGRDVSDLHEALEAKRKGDAVVRTIATTAPIVIAALDASGCYVHLEGRGLEEFGVTPGDVTGRSAFEVHADGAMLADLRRALAGSEVSGLYTSRGRSWDTRYTPVRDELGLVTGVVIVALDITDRVAAESRFSQIVEHFSDIVTIHDADGPLQWASPAATRILGRPSGHAVAGQRIAPHVHPDDREVLLSAFLAWREGKRTAVEYRIEDVNRNLRYVESVGANMLDHPAIRGIVVTTRDVTERREMQRELAHLALHDRLTDLPNRTLLLDRLGQVLAASRRDGRAVAVALVDVDHLKLVNDAFGHETGDELIRDLARVLATATRPGDTVARLGADEFAVCLPGMPSVEEAAAITHRILGRVTGRRTVAGRTIHLSATVGLVVSDAASNPEQLLADAELAMYRGKQRGRGGVELFSESARAQVTGRLALQQELRSALENDEFRMFFQPQVRVDTGEIVSFEALLRWEHPERGLLNPAAFIGVAEQSRLIGPIGAWTLQESCRQAAIWRNSFPERRLRVSVNLSARQLEDEHLPEIVQDAIAAAGIEPSVVCLELTESMLMEDAEAAVAMLRRLKQIGVRLAIDDFGTGYSSLAYLKRFPIDQLKVDRTFVAGLGRDHEDYVIVSAIVNLARALGVEVVAEGVENDRHLSELESTGCELAQGYLWSPPVPASTVPAMLTRRRIPREIREVAPADRVAPASAQAIDVVSLLTHELRAPLTVIKGYAEMVAGQAGAFESPIVAKASSAIARNVTVLDELISALSDVNALEAGSLPLRRIGLDVAELVRSTVADHGHLFPNHEVRIAVDGGRYRVEADASRIRQVLLNLLTNAAKFGPADAGIDIAVTASERDVHVAVIDYGPGVPPELAREIFRKFFRADVTKQGTGLGLYLARSLVRAHGGDVTCRHAAAGGAEFVVTLPMPGSRPDPTSDQARGAPADQPAREVPVSAGTSAAIAAAALRLRGAVVAEHVPAAGIELTRRLGGTTVPARVTDPAATLHDLSCGIGESLLAAAEPGSDTRQLLDQVLPRFLEDAASTLRRLDREPPDAGQVDPLTGFLGRRVLPRHVAKLRDADVVLLLRLGDRSPHGEAMRALGRIVREVAPLDATLGRFGDDQVAVLLGATADTAETAATARDLVEVVAREWERRRPRPLALAAGYALVANGAPQVALVEADAASTTVVA